MYRTIAIVAALTLTLAWPVGAAEVCDGRDNDNDGLIDESCDGLCNAATAAGVDVPLSFDPLPGDPSPAGAGSPTTARVAWTGSQYGVVWQDYSADPAYSGRDLFFRRFDGAGGGFGDQIRVTQMSGESAQADIVVADTAGYGFAIVWEDNRSGLYKLYFERYSTLGSLAVNDKLLTTTAVSPRSPRIDHRGGTNEFGIVYESGSKIGFKRINTDGNSVSSEVIVTSASNANANEPDLVWTGSEWGVTWHDRRDGNNEIYFRRVTAAGAVIGASDIRITNQAANSIYPTIAWSGSQYGIAWADYRDGNNEIYFVRLDAEGNELGTERRLTSDAEASSSFPQVVWTGEEWNVTWQSVVGAFSEIYSKRVRANGVPFSPKNLVSDPGDDGSVPHAIWNGADVVVVWSGHVGPVSDIRFDRLRCCDDLDGDGFNECAGDPDDGDAASYPGAAEVCDGADNNGDAVVDESCDSTCSQLTAQSPDQISSNNAGAFSKSMAWTGDDYGVYWTELGAGFFRRVAADGTPITAATALGSGTKQMIWNGHEFGLLGGSDFTRADLAGNVLSSHEVAGLGDMDWSGGEYGVVYDAVIGSVSRIYFYRIGSNGTQIGDPIEIGTGARPDIVWDGAGWGVTYVTASNIVLLRIDSQGAVLGAPEIVGTGSSFAPPAACTTFPRIAWTGTTYGIAWAYDDRLRIATADAAGTALDDIQLTDSSANACFPEIVWTGEEFGVAWHDDRSGGDQVRLSRVQLDPTLSELQETEISPGGYRDSENPVLVWNGDQYAVAYAHLYYDCSSNPCTPIGSREIWFQRIRCCGIDVDGDGSGQCSDCDDADADVFPNGPGACDGKNNDCNSPGWPAIAGTEESDDDGDGSSECEDDCDDALASVGPGAAQVCDGLNNDCYHPAYPSLAGTNESDDDVDGVSECAGDCDDGDAARFPGNLEVCDSLDNDCDTVVPADEQDTDLDGYAPCGGDCNDSDGATFPDAPETNDGIDNQCTGELGHGVIDEVSGVPEIDGDTISWPDQAGAMLYQVARATSADFTASCTTFFSSTATFVDPDPTPPLGESYYYMIRSIVPFQGSWGADAMGVERSVPCAP